MEMFENKGIVADTLYFGGGTPNLLKSDLLIKIINHSKLLFKGFKEITVEANPNSITETWLSSVANSGVNRISFGMQSAIENELISLNRKHNFSDVEHAVKLAKKHGINNISVDLMLGIPYQNLETVKISLDKINSLDITHISAYILKIEENTAFNDNNIIDTLPNEDLVSDIYLYVCDALNKKGFKQYEISNFAKVGCESKHNLKYWLGNDYLGFGPSAHSYYNKNRFFYDRDINSFISGSYKLPLEDNNSDMTLLEEYLIFHLRLTNGIDLRYLEGSFNIDIKKFLTKVKIYVINGFINLQDNTLSLTPKGFLVSNELILNILNFLS